MMKWGRKKSSSSSPSFSDPSSHSHLISHVFPLSLLSKFKQTDSKPASRIQKNNQKVKQNLQRINSKSSSRFHKQDNDGSWRVSFGEDNMDDHNNSKDIVKTVRRNSDHGNCKSKINEKSNKTHGVHEPKGTPGRAEMIKGKETSSKEGAKDESLRRTYRRIIEATRELQKELGEVKDGFRKSSEKEMSEQELLRVYQTTRRAKQSGVSLRDLDGFCRQTHEEKGSEWQLLKDAKIKESLRKSDKQRKSFHISSDTQIRGMKQSKVRVCSPRTTFKTESCKIKALEDLKKANMKKKMKEKAHEDEARALGSFAVVKCSVNPQQDFRDSMVEMITEKGIRRPGELEELLACYLTLNADEYHDLIIKIFRQVWCELEEAYFNQKEKHYFDA